MTDTTTLQAIYTRLSRATSVKVKDIENRSLRGAASVLRNAGIWAWVQHRPGLTALGCGKALGLTRQQIDDAKNRTAIRMDANEAFAALCLVGRDGPMPEAVVQRFRDAAMMSTNRKGVQNGVGGEPLPKPTVKGCPHVAMGKALAGVEFANEAVPVLPTVMQSARYIPQTGRTSAADAADMGE